MKMPEPAYRRLSDLQSGVDDYYTANQMRQYRIDTLEEAAQICDERVSADKCAIEIRALKERSNE